MAEEILDHSEDPPDGHLGRLPRSKPLLDTLIPTLLANAQKGCLEVPEIIWGNLIHLVPQQAYTLFLLWQAGDKGLHIEDLHSMLGGQSMYPSSQTAGFISRLNNGLDHLHSDCRVASTGKGAGIPRGTQTTYVLQCAHTNVDASRSSSKILSHKTLLTIIYLTPLQRKFFFRFLEKSPGHICVSDLRRALDESANEYIYGCIFKLQEVLRFLGSYSLIVSQGEDKGKGYALVENVSMQIDLES